MKRAMINEDKLDKDFKKSTAKTVPPATGGEPDRSKLDLLLLSNGALAEKRNETIQQLFGIRGQ